MAAITPLGVTASYPFFSCNSARTSLFSVNPGVPTEDALQMVQCILEDALDAMNHEEETNFAVHRLVTLAKAVVDATVKGLPESEPAEPVVGEKRQGKTRYFDVIAQFHQLHRDGVLMISPDASDLDEDDALSMFDTARTIACGGAQ